MSGGGGRTLGLPALWLLDLDGVIWLAGTPIGDVGGAVRALRAHGAAVAFVTNNSSPTLSALQRRLAAVGIEAATDELVTSARAAASLLEPGQSATVLAEAGVLEALDERGVAVAGAGEGPGDAAVVGWSREFDFAALTRISTAARTSGRLVATNGDPTHPTPDGLVPGSGALLAAVAAASGVAPEIAGKPHEPIVRFIAEHLGVAPGADVVVVGDQPGTDGLLAERLGVPFALVDSGVTSPDDPADGCAVAERAPDLVTLVDRVLGR
jgi:HAD superfamily hydrolase (TIGR01450 family)